MNDKQKKCSGFPGKPGECKAAATAVVIRARQHVCEEHAKQAEAKKFQAQRAEKKS